MVSADLASLGQSTGAMRSVARLLGSRPIDALALNAGIQTGHRRPFLGRRVGARLCRQLSCSFLDRRAVEGAAAIRRTDRRHVERGARSRRVLPDGYRTGDMAGSNRVGRSRSFAGPRRRISSIGARPGTAPPNCSSSCAPGIWRRSCRRLAASPSTRAWCLGRRSVAIAIGRRSSDGSTSCRAWRPFSPGARSLERSAGDLLWLLTEADARSLSGQYVDGRTPRLGSSESRDPAKIARAIEVAYALLDRYVKPSNAFAQPPL